MAYYESPHLKRIQDAKKHFEGLQDDVENVDFASKDLGILPGELLVRLTNLKHLDLSFDSLKAIPSEIGCLSELMTLKLRANLLTYIPTSIGLLDKLREIQLDKNQLVSFPEVFTHLTQLKILKMSFNQIPSIPASIANLVKLEHFDISYNQLSSLPPEIGCLRELREFDVQFNPFYSIPAEFASLTNLEKFHLKGTKVASFFLSLTCENLIAYLKELQTGQSQWKELKLVFVGEGNVGKSTLLKLFTTNTLPKSNIATDGIDIAKWDTEGMQINCYDFGGQEVFYPTHQFFTTARSLYIIVYDLQDEKLSKLEYWSEYVKRLSSPSPQVIVVGTHMDSAKCTPSYLEQVQYRIESLRVSKYSNYKHMTTVSCVTGKGISELRAKVIEMAKQQSIIKQPVATSFVKINEFIKKYFQNENYMLWEDFSETILANFPIKEEMLKTLVTFLYHAGNLVLFQDLIIFNPKWLAQIMASIISFKNKFKDGIVSAAILVKLWAEYPEEIRTTLTQLLTSFEIIYKMRGRNDLIVPSLLDSEYDKERPYMPSALVKEILKAEIKEGSFELRRYYKLGFMPLGFFSRLIVKLYHREVGVVEAWREGALIQSDKESAVISYNTDTYEVKIVVRTYREYMSTPQYHARNLLSLAVSCVEELLSNYYSNNLNEVERIIPCSHCINGIVTVRMIDREVEIPPEIVAPIKKKHSLVIGGNLSSSSMLYTKFRLEDCISALATGEENPYVICKRNQVLIEDLAPDLMMRNFLLTEKVEVGEQLGKGGLGIVYRGKMGDKIVAVKRLMLSAKHTLDLSNSDSYDILEKFLEFKHEVTIMSQLNHPNLLKLYGITLSPLQMVLEYAPFSDLRKILNRNTSNKIPFMLKLKIALDMAKAIAYMHSKYITHRDIRSPNIFVVSLDPEADISAKVADFGLAQRVDPAITEIQGTWQWLPPEVIDFKAKGYNERVDIYSFGMVFWEMITHELPFVEYTDYIKVRKQELTSEEIENQELLNQMEEEGWLIKDGFRIKEEFDVQQIKDAIINNDLRPTIPVNCHSEVAEIIRQCWLKDPLARPSMKDIVDVLSSLIGIEQKSGNVKTISREKTELKIKCLEKMDIGLKDSTEIAIGNDYLFVGTHEGKILVWDIHKRQRVLQTEIHLQKINSMIYSPYNNLLWTTSQDKSLRIWREKSMAVEIPDFSGKSHNNIMWRIRHFKYNPSTQSLDAFNNDKKPTLRKSIPLKGASIEICNTHKIENCWKLKGQDNNVLHIASNEVIEVADLPGSNNNNNNNNKLDSWVFSLSKGIEFITNGYTMDLELVEEASFVQFGGISCSCEIDDKIFYAFASFRIIFMWDVKTREHKRTVRFLDSKLSDNHRIKCMVKYRDGMLVAINDLVYEVDLVAFKPSAKHILRVEDNVQCMVVVDDKLWIASECERSTRISSANECALYVYSLADGKRLAKIECEPILRMVYTNNVVITTGLKAIHIWNKIYGETNDEKPVVVPSKHDGELRCLLIENERPLEFLTSDSQGSVCRWK